MILEIKRSRGTIWFVLASFKTKEVYSLYFQFSLQDPWWIPSHKHIGEIPLWGWLFFYFGRLTEGVLEEIDAGESDDKKMIVDRKGNAYAICTISGKQMREKVRSAIRRGAEIHVEKQTWPDGTIDRTIIAKIKQKGDRQDVEGTA